MDQNLTLRFIKVRDFEGVESLFERSLLENQDSLTQIRISSEQLAWEMRRVRQNLILEERYLCFVAELEGELVGYIAGVLERQPAMYEVSLFLSIHEIYVVEAFRRRGVGKLLCQSLEEHAKSLGVRWITVQCMQENAGLCAFFESLGYPLKALEFRRQLES